MSPPFKVQNISGFPMKFRFPLWKKNKSWKRPYSGSKRFDYSCRNHGGCPYCENGRTFFDLKYRRGWEDDLKDYFDMSLYWEYAEDGWPDMTYSSDDYYGDVV